MAAALASSVLRPSATKSTEEQMKPRPTLGRCLRVAILALSMFALAPGLAATALAKGSDSHQPAAVSGGGSQHDGGGGQAKNTGQASRPDAGGNAGEQRGDMHGVKA